VKDATEYLTTKDGGKIKEVQIDPTQDKMILQNLSGYAKPG